RVPARGQGGQQGGCRLAEVDGDGALIRRLDAGDGGVLTGLWRGGRFVHDALDAGYDIGAVEAAAVVEGGLDECEGISEPVVGDAVLAGQRRHDVAALVDLHKRVVERLRDLKGCGSRGELRIEHVGLGCHRHGDALGGGEADYCTEQ